MSPASPARPAGSRSSRNSRTFRRTSAALLFVAAIASSACDASTGPDIEELAPASLCSPTTTVGALALNVPVSGHVGVSDCILPHGVPGDGYRLHVTEESALRFDVTGMVVTGAVVATLAVDDFTVIGVGDVGPTGVATLAARFQPGDYVLWITTYDGAPTNYTLRMTPTTLQSCDEVDGPIAVGSTVLDSLTSADCILPDSRVADVFELTLNAPTTIRIDEMSTDFDSYLLVEDQQGELIAEDDDGGGGLNSRLELALPAGTYRLMPSTYWSGTVGNYSLTVSVVGSSVVGSSVVGSSVVAPHIRRVQPQKAPAPAVRSWATLAPAGAALALKGG